MGWGGVGLTLGGVGHWLVDFDFLVHGLTLSSPWIDFWLILSMLTIGCLVLISLTIGWLWVDLWVTLAWVGLDLILEWF